jgi:ketosteroid isomerase-like protein
MTRRIWLLGAMPLVLRGDAAGEAWDALADAAAALGQDNAARFLAAFDPAMPGFAGLRANIQGLLAAWDVQASIDLVDRQAEAAGFRFELNWLLVVTDRNGAGRSRRTRNRVSCRLSKAGKRWTVAAFEPLAMFAPPMIN